MRLVKFHMLGHAGYWASAIVVVLMGGALYNAASAAHDSVLLTDNAVQVLDDVSGLAEALSRAKAAQRGFLLSIEERFLERRDAAWSDVAKRLAHAKGRLAGNGEEQRRLSALGTLLDERRRSMLEDEHKRRSGELDLISTPWSGPERQHSSMRIARIVAELHEHAFAVLEARRREQEAQYTWALWTLAVSVLICLTVMIPGYLAFVHESRARRGAEKRLIELTESLPGVVYQYRMFPDGTARYEFLSGGVTRMRDIDRETALKDPHLIQATILDEDREPFLRTVAEATKSLSPIEFDYRIQRADGAIRWIRSTAAPRAQPDGSVLWSGHWGDVTERIGLERAMLESKEAAEAANQAKTTFVTTMSHEIRTPMNGVLGMLELLARTGLEGEQRTMLQIVQDSGRSLLRIIDDILDFSKIEAGKLELTPEPASITQLVEGVFNVYSGIASNKGLVLSRVVDSRISPAVMVDPLRLRQVLNNLLSNAIKFTHSGEIELLADLVDRADGRDVVRFAVRDTGIGISSDAQRRLFRPYAQALAGTAHQYGGTGLGLAICQRLATLMGGAVGVESQLAKGTVMMLTVPLPVADAASLSNADAFAAAAPAPLATRDAPTVADAEAEGTLVLIVDDHPVNRVILVRQVSMLGYAVEAAEDGLAALHKWRSGRFAMVITDCEMPQMNGYDLARAMRQVEALDARPRTPIVACTAYAIVGEAQTCIAAGMDDYLSKPVDLKRLQEKLGKWLPIPVAAGGREPAAPSDDAAVIDRAALASISGGDRALEDELLARFAQCCEDDARQLRHALDRSRLDEARSAAHRMKGASRTVAAHAFARACEEIERAARDGDAHAAAAGVAAFDRELERLRRYLEALRQDRQKRAP